jgi:hypothetical protein
MSNMSDGRITRDWIPERVRRPLALVFQWGGWLGCLGVGIWATDNYDPHKGQFAPQWVGFLFIALIGIAMAGTTARSRMRLTDAIVHAFQAGRLTAREDFGTGPLAGKDEKRLEGETSNTRA